MKKNRSSYFIILGLFIYLIIPLLFTFIYSVSTKWQNTLLPEGLTLAHYKSIFETPRYLQALSRTMLVAVLSILISFVLLVPVIYLGRVHYPWLERLMSKLILLPFAFQGVILAVGLLKIYSSGPVAISGTLYILIGAYFVVILPHMYQGIKNSIDSLDVKMLVEAASLMGASETYTFFKVLLPSLMKGVTVSVLLSFALLMGEFVLANMLAGGNYETVQVYLHWSRGVSGHYSSAIITGYFLIILIVTGGVLWINRLETRKE